MEVIDSPIFKGFTKSDFESLWDKQILRLKHYRKGTVILHAGDTTHDIGIVIDGSADIEHIDSWGGVSLLSHVAASEVFAETYAITGEPLMVDVVASEDAHIALFDVVRCLSDTSHSSSNRKLQSNLLAISMRKNLALSTRIVCTSPKTIRGRLLIYLSSESVKHASNIFDIELDRQQMADYLHVDRSALSKELGLMRDEGLISFHKNHFEIT